MYITDTSLICQQETIGDGRPRNRCRHLANWTNIGIVFDSGSFAPSRENMTSYIKPEVHIELLCHRKRTEPRPHVTRTENIVKFGHVVFKICESTDKQTDKHTYRQADRNTAPVLPGRSKNIGKCS